MILKHALFVTALALCTTPAAWADEPSPEQFARAVADDAARVLVELTVVQPMEQKDSGEFSRSAAQTRTDYTARLDPGADLMDAKANTFRRYVVVAFDRKGEEAVVVKGCVYAKTREVYVQRKHRLYPAALLKGKRVKSAPDGTCVAK